MCANSMTEVDVRGAMNFPRIAALPASLALLFPLHVNAQAVGDRYWLEGSVYLPSVDSEIQVTDTGSANPGTVVDMETVLGLDDDETLPAFSAGMRIGRNVVLVADYYSVGRDATKALDRSITIDDVTFPVNGQITTGFDSDIYRFTVGYSFYHKDNVEIGAAIGLHATNFEVSVTGNGTVNGTPVQGAVRRQEFLAPIPTLGLYGSVRVADGLTLSGRVDYLSMKIDEYDGELANTQVALSYQVIENVAIGAMYRYVNYKVGVEKPNYTGDFHYKFSGPAVFLRLRL